MKKTSLFMALMLIVAGGITLPLCGCGKSSKTELKQNNGSVKRSDAEIIRDVTELCCSLMKNWYFNSTGNTAYLEAKNVSLQNISRSDDPNTYYAKLVLSNCFTWKLNGIYNIRIEYAGDQVQVKLLD